MSSDLHKSGWLPAATWCPRSIRKIPPIQRRSRTDRHPPKSPRRWHRPVQDAAPEPFDVPATFDEFRLLRPLGRGAMGQVYLGHDTLLDRSVAIKFRSSDGRGFFPGWDPPDHDEFRPDRAAVGRAQRLAAHVGC